MSMPPNNLLTWIVFATFNLPILAIFIAVPFGKFLDNALKEKTPTGDSTGVASYSRVTGALGAVILTAFFWAIGNVVLADTLSPNAAATIGPLLNAVGRFFLVGSALFLPYAFNQLKTLFPWSANASTAQAALGAQAVAPANYGADEVTQITIANVSSTVTDVQLQAVLAAIGVQVSQQFKPEWGQSAVLSMSRPDLTGSTVPVNAATGAVIYLGDQVADPKTGAQSVMGYHDVNCNAMPYGFVYLDVCSLYDEPWSATLSHEVLELLADPTAAMSVASPSGSGITYELEVCDPTQGDRYTIGDVAVSNFVNRAFFDLPGGLSPAMNYCRLSQAAFSPRPNGYVQFTDSTGATQQTWGADVSDSQKAARVLLGPFRRNARRSARRQPLSTTTVAQRNQ
jgi:hypothetical protein